MNGNNGLKIESKTNDVTLVEPARAAIELQAHFIFEARRLRRRDWAMQEDLVQEMSHLVLRCRTPMTLAYFKTAARLRAINYLRYEDRRRKVPACLPMAQRINERSEDISDEEQLERDEERERRMYLDIFQKASRIHNTPLPEVDGTTQFRKESA